MKVTQSCPTLCDPLDCSPPGSSVHGDSPGKNTGVGCHTLFQGIFPKFHLIIKYVVISHFGSSSSITHYTEKYPENYQPDRMKEKKKNGELLRKLPGDIHLHEYMLPLKI